MGAVSGIARIEVATGRGQPFGCRAGPAERDPWGAGMGLRAGRYAGRGVGGRDRGDAPRPRTRFNEELGGRLLPRLEVVRWRSGAGEVEGVLAHPTTSASGRRPLLVIPHGGPRDHTSALFDPQTAYFASLGYLVLRPNFRGSTGYGDAFTRGNVANWGAGPFEDVMTGVDALVARGLADPARLFLYGWSYGGYLATGPSPTPTASGPRQRGGRRGPAHAVRDERRAAMAVRLLLGQPLHGKPGGLRTRVAHHLRRLRRVPTLFLHGEQDVRVPPAQGWMMYRGLRDVGIETEMVVYPREGHGFDEPQHVLDRLRRIADWFARHDVRAR